MPSLKLPLAALSSYLLARSWPAPDSNIPLSSYPTSARTSILFSSALLSLIVWYRWIYPSLFSPLRHLPRPRAPWRDSLYRWLYTELDPGQLLEHAQKVPNGGLLYYTGVGGAPRVLLTNHEALREVLVEKSYEVFMKPGLVRERIAVFAGHGVIAAEGEAHKMHRSKLLPAFHYRHVKELYPLFWEKAAEMSNVLSDEVRNKTRSTTSLRLDIAEWTSRAALDIIGIAAWGKELGTIANPDTPFYSKYRKIFEANAQGAALAALGLFIPMWMVSKIPVQYNHTLHDGMTAVRKLCKEAIAEERTRREKGSKPSNNLMSIAMDSGAFDDAELEEEMMSMLAAGHETSGLTVAWACFILAKNPDIQEKLRREVRSSLPSPSDGAQVDADKLDGLPYLKAVTSELLRLIPAVPVTRREAKVDTTILGNPVPKGTWLVASGWVTNKLVSNWGDDAATFNPGRWLVPGNENSGGVKVNYDNMTFSHGPRSCLGAGFARAEFLALLAALVGRFEMGLEDPGFEPKIEFTITTHAAGGLKVNLRALEGW